MEAKRFFVIATPLDVDKVVGLGYTWKSCMKEYEGVIQALGTEIQAAKLPVAGARARDAETDTNKKRQEGWTYLSSPPSDADASEYELEVELLLTHRQAQEAIALATSEKDAKIAFLEHRLRDTVSEMIHRATRSTCEGLVRSALSLCETNKTHEEIVQQVVGTLFGGA